MLVKCLVQWLSADPSCHLHSTDTPEFCEEEEEDTGGSASVSMTAAVSELEDGEEEEDEEDTATVPGGRDGGFKMCRVWRQVEASFRVKAEIQQ